MKVFRILLDLLFPPRENEALVREATTETLGMHARARLIDGRIATLLPYRTRLVRACVLEAKFRDNTEAQQLLASVLADHLLESDIESPVLVPVPLSRERRAERGYNQTERVAEKAKDRMDALVVDAGLLCRLRDTLPQTSLGRQERRKNLEDAFGVTRALDPAHTYIVFDDVLTTGSTLKSCMDALRKAGAAKVYGLSLAH